MTQNFNRFSQGFTLIELMITVGVLAVIASIALPMYSSYVSTARETEGWNNLRTLQVAEEEFFLNNNTYFQGASAAALEAASGGLWQRAEAAADANFEYSVTITGPTTYTATATGQNSVAPSVILTVTKN